MKKIFNFQFFLQSRITLRGTIFNLVRHPLFSGSFVMIVGSMGINFINYIYHFLMARILGPVGYGELASLISILYIISIVPISTSISIVKFISSAKTDKEKVIVYKSIRKLVFYIATFCAIAVVVLSGIIGNFLHIQDLISIILMGPILFFTLTILVNTATLQGLLRFSGVILPNIVHTILRLLVGLVLVIAGLSVKGAIIGFFLGTFFAYLVSVYILEKYLKTNTAGNNNSHNLKPFLRYSAPVLVQALAFTSLFTTDIILVKHFLSPSDAGIYAALSTLGKIIYFAAQPASQVMFPIVSTRVSRGERYFKVLWVSLGITVSVAFFILGIFTILPNIAGFLYGSRFLLTRENIFLMSLFMSIYTAGYFLVNFFLSIGRTKVVVLPVGVAILQMVGITLWHSSISQVIYISISSSVLLVVSLFAYLGYNRLAKVYGKNQS